MTIHRPFVAALLLLAAFPARAGELPHDLIAPGMTITQVQALMGQPHAIKSLRAREALFYCPRSWWGIPLGEPIYTTVWLVHRRVVAARTSVSPNLGTCEGYIAAFQWSDPLPQAAPTYRPQR